MSEQTLTATWLSVGRKPEHPADPKYPHGVDLDLGRRPACAVDLPYPAPEVGVWLVECAACGGKFSITAAGRADDPRSARVPCKTREANGAATIG